jgi:hypothetical protein
VTAERPRGKRAEDPLQLQKIMDILIIGDVVFKVNIAQAEEV